MLSENAVRAWLFKYRDVLLSSVPGLSQDAARLSYLARETAICCLPVSMKVGSPQSFRYSVEDRRFMVPFRALNQAIDLRPCICDNGLLPQPPVLILFENASEGSLLHEMSHIFSFGWYFRTNAGKIYHKRGSIYECFEVYEVNLACVHTHGTEQENECLTNFCADRFHQKMKSRQEEYVRNVAYRNFLECLADSLRENKISEKEIIFRYIHDPFFGASSQGFYFQNRKNVV